METKEHAPQNRLQKVLTVSVIADGVPHFVKVCRRVSHLVCRTWLECAAHSADVSYLGRVCRTSGVPRVSHLYNPHQILSSPQDLLYWMHKK